MLRRGRARLAGAPLSGGEPRNEGTAPEGAIPAGAALEEVRGALVDVDGTLLLGEAAIPGAAGAVAGLRAAAIPFRLTTNTTRRSRRSVAAALSRVGIAVAEHEVLVPSVLARRHVLASGRTRALLLVAPDSLPDFEGIEPVETRADWVIVGDLGAGFTFERVDLAFRLLREGAGLVALHRNRWWMAGEGEPRLDAGAYVAGLEYAAGVRALTAGKPSRAFFELATAELGLPPSEVLVVGDDVENDADGGKAAGCRTALVRTGKFSDAALARAAFPPDLVLDSVARLALRPRGR